MAFQSGARRKCHLSFATSILASDPAGARAIVLAAKRGDERAFGILFRRVLLARMGMQVSVDAPDAAMVAPQPPFVGETLHAALSTSSERVFPGVTISLTPAQQPHLAFIVGLGDSPCRVPCWWLTGTAWSGALVDSERIATAWRSDWPIGAMSSALLGASEAFKHVIRQLPLRYPEDRLFLAAALV
jgi:hypothetical protein